MSQDFDLARLARLARLEIAESDTALYGIEEAESWIEQVGKIDTDGVAPMTSPGVSEARLREDVVEDGERREQVLGNAPEHKEGFFLVPKVIE